VSGGAAGLWLAEVMLKGEGQMFLHNGRVLRRLNDFSVRVFDRTMCRRTITLTRMTRRWQDEDDIVFYYIFIMFLLKFY
jgi:hypothetical protein